MTILRYNLLFFPELKEIICGYIRLRKANKKITMIFSWISDTLLRQKYTEAATRGDLEKWRSWKKACQMLPGEIRSQIHWKKTDTKFVSSKAAR